MLTCKLPCWKRQDSKARVDHKRQVDRASGRSIMIYLAGCACCLTHRVNSLALAALGYLLNR